MNTASQYCKTLDNVTREELVNALHQALMQLGACDKLSYLSGTDNKSAIAEASRVLTKAGHIGFPALMHRPFKFRRWTRKQGFIT